MTPVPTISDLVDRLGALEASLDIPAVAKWKADEKRAAALRKLLADRIVAPAEETTTVKGKRYTAVIGARSQQTTIVSLCKVYAFAKKAAFLDACSMTLKALEQLIPDDLVRSRLLKTERTGSRSVATYPIEQTAKGMQKAA